MVVSSNINALEELTRLQQANTSSASPSSSSTSSSLRHQHQQRLSVSSSTTPLKQFSFVPTVSSSTNCPSATTPTPTTTTPTTTTISSGDAGDNINQSFRRKSLALKKPLISYANTSEKKATTSAMPTSTVVVENVQARGFVKASTLKSSPASSSDQSWLQRKQPEESSMVDLVSSSSDSDDAMDVLLSSNIIDHVVDISNTKGKHAQPLPSSKNVTGSEKNMSTKEGVYGTKATVTDHGRKEFQVEPMFEGSEIKDFTDDEYDFDGIRCIPPVVVADVHKVPTSPGLSVDAQRCLEAVVRNIGDVLGVSSLPTKKENYDKYKELAEGVKSGLQGLLSMVELRIREIPDSSIKLREAGNKKDLDRARTEYLHHSDIVNNNTSSYSDKAVPGIVPTNTDATSLCPSSTSIPQNYQSKSIVYEPQECFESLVISDDDCNDDNNDDIIAESESFSSTSTVEKKSGIQQQQRNSTDGDLSLESHKWSKRMRAMMKKRFGHDRYRMNQLLAINAVMKGLDVFILMPTGGGKSLCYQLPGFCFEPRGITVVVSPLLSLIQDQVESLEAKGIAAVALTGETPRAVHDFVDRDLQAVQPQTPFIYTTPERISLSGKFLSQLDSLYRRNLLRLVVIDEAHCVSQWGHDFRSDYKKMGIFKTRFPSVPVMALTATATQRVRKDILLLLQIPNALTVAQSFNRSNLSYDVLVKSMKKTDQVSTVVEFIRKNYNHKASGIVYCFSRKETEDIAERLSELGVRALPYHAGMSTSEKADNQRAWAQNAVPVIVATIAFGMGINKPDVRFVIHYSMPKSIEGYYQESGRAGRDGRPARCVLFFHYADAKKQQALIETGEYTSVQQREHNLNNLHRITEFCSNVVDCRRKQILQYFSQNFNPEECNRTCDNCRSGIEYHSTNLTLDAKKIVELVSEIPQKKATVQVVNDVIRGANTKGIGELKKHRHHGLASNYIRGDSERFIHKLILDGVLEEKCFITSYHGVSSYLILGRRQRALVQGQMKVLFRVRTNHSTNKKTLDTVGGDETLLDEEAIGCLDQLRAWLSALSGTLRIAAHNLIQDRTLVTLSRMRPRNLKELKNVPGITEMHVTKYGSDIIGIMVNYRAPSTASIAAALATERASATSSPYFSGGTEKTEPSAKSKRQSVKRKSLPISAKTKAGTSSKLSRRSLEDTNSKRIRYEKTNIY